MKTISTLGEYDLCSYIVSDRFCIICASRRVLVSWLKLRAEAEGHTQQKMDSGFAHCNSVGELAEGGKAAADG